MNTTIQWILWAFGAIGFVASCVAAVMLARGAPTPDDIAMATRLATDTTALARTEMIMGKPVTIQMINKHYERQLSLQRRTREGYWILILGFAFQAIAVFGQTPSIH